MVLFALRNGAFCRVKQFFPPPRNMPFYAKKGFIAAHGGAVTLHRIGIFRVTICPTARCGCTLIASIFATARLVVRPEGSYEDIRKVRM